MEIFRDDEGVVQVRGDLHISEAEELRTALIGSLETTPALSLDLSEVNACDTAGFQLLCSLQKSAKRDGKEFRIAAMSAGMHAVSAILGLSLEDLTNISKS
jgi:anti-anti-sigma factor